jgi:hypothetical protein
MAPHAYALKLTTPAAYADGRIDPGPLPEGLPPEFVDAAPLIDFGLLAGEAVGVDITPATELLEEVTRSAEIRRETYPDAVRLLSNGDLGLLGGTLAEVASALRSALDDAGHPVGAAGERLVAHEHVHTDDHGRAVVGSRGVLAADLASELPEVARFLDAAAERDLFVVML